MDKVSPELAQEVLRLMIQDGVTLTGDLNQCERAVGAWVRKVGAATLEAHLAGKKTTVAKLTEVVLRDVRDRQPGHGGSGVVVPGCGGVLQGSRAACAIG